MKPIIAILTDFGTTDPYVGTMKGVIATIAPGATTIDITHAITPGDIAQGAITFWQAAPFFPAGTIFLGVVDPGVGTRRHPMILQTPKFTFVGPDNGLFSFVANENWRAWELANPTLRLPAVRNTFHGRDIFAPAAAHASLGKTGPEFGAAIRQMVRLPAPKLTQSPTGKLRGEILRVDQFGNLLTSLGIFTARAGRQVEFQTWQGTGEKVSLTFEHLSLPDGTVLYPAETFADIPADQCGFIIGSNGLIEIVANRQSAAKRLNLPIGTEIELSIYPEINSGGY